MAGLRTMRLMQLLLGINGAFGALTVDFEDQESIRNAASNVADDLMTFYNGEEEGMIPGMLPGPPPDGDYYWWSGAALWSSLLDHRNLTGDTTHDDSIMLGLWWQTGDNDFLPTNWTASVGNDEQASWALAAILAAETGFKDPADNNARWVDVAKTVFEDQSNEYRRVSEGNCTGALRWQIYPSNQGYDYISTAANAAYFNLGSRLAFFTNNGTISERAASTYDLLSDIGFVDDEFNVYDGAHVPQCDQINRLQFSYNAAMLLQGCAHMYKYTGDEAWKSRMDGLINRTLELFFPDGVAVEVSCENAGTCNTDMKLFKGYLHRALGSTARLVPDTADRILPVLMTSAEAAAATCTGGEGGRMCGFAWAAGEFDEASAGAQSSVLSALISVLTQTNGPIPGESSNGGSNDNNSNDDNSNDNNSNDDNSNDNNSNDNNSNDNNSNDNNSNGNSEAATDEEPPVNLGTRGKINLGIMLGALIAGAVVGI
ncbi:hypothetical protein DL764_000731 [Monosporascus ibericus]|uniref:Mannan endo-1,6-alpha-mannosidase n=1 Tax=Monosporascus ibericus TaxID=155417 RepID=A0A4V1XCM2_9PEZI|nr:hypothetical protein DL764_000731 [Monosporascus ibericus]